MLFCSTHDFVSKLMLPNRTLSHHFGNMCYVSNIEIYAGSHLTNTQHSMAYIAVGGFNQKVWIYGCMVTRHMV
jgi:hypothetical protein